MSESGVHNSQLGPEAYRESEGMEIDEGANAVVTGFSIGEDIAVCSMKISGNTYIFRNEDGRPAWAGGSHGPRQDWDLEGSGGHGEGRGYAEQAVAQLTAEFHLAMATLIEAEAEENPDEAKVKQLTEQVETLRAKLRSTGGRGQERGRAQGRGGGHGQGQRGDQSDAHG